MNELILYTTEDGQCRIQLRADRETVWLSQRQMADLFDVSSDNISLHLKKIYEEGELCREATAEESSVVQKEGEREVQRSLTLYNLDANLNDAAIHMTSLLHHRSTGIPKVLRVMQANGSPGPRFESADERSSFLIRLPVHEGFAEEPGPDATGDAGTKSGPSRDQALVLQACREESPLTNLTAKGRTWLEEGLE
jgi:predicted HTH transcriptional regulator